MRSNRFKVWDNKNHKFISDVSKFSLADLDHDDSSQYIFSQWTGAVDSEGNDIFEGDIMSAIQDVNTKGIVVFEEGQYRLWSGRGTKLQECFEIDVLSKLFTVIGNIYENPEQMPPRDLVEETP